jgi:hypothetical protein
MNVKHIAVWMMLLLVGCGTSDIFEHFSDGPPQPVSGRVQYRNYALNGGWIVFHSENHQTFTAEVFSDGTFTLNSGLIAGRYRITVTNHKSAHWGLPSRYNDPQLSGLACTVEANQPLRLRIELE